MQAKSKINVTENYSNKLATIKGPGGTYVIRFGFITSTFLLVHSDPMANEFKAIGFDNYEAALSKARTLAQ